MTTLYTVDGAIARSSAYDEIVTVIVADLDQALSDMTDGIDEYDYVDTRDHDGHRMREVWDASDTSGRGMMDWRVHLVERQEAP